MSVSANQLPDPWAREHVEVLLRERDRLVGLFARKLGDRELAKDIAHDAVVAVLKRLANGVVVENLAKFLWTVALRKLSRAYNDPSRRLRDANEDFSGGEMGGTAPRLDEQIDARAILRCIASDPRNEILVRCASGSTPRELAAEKGVEVTTISEKVSARRSSLRRQLGWSAPSRRAA